MKRLLLIVLLFVTGLSHSQVLLSLIFGDKLNSEGLEFGLEGGVNFSNISNMDTSSNIAPFNIGFYFDIRLKNQWSLYTGVLVKSQLGVDKLSENDLEFLNARVYEEPGTYSQRSRHFIIPILMKYEFNNHIYIEGGAQIGWRRKAWIEFRSDNAGIESIIKQTNSDQLNRMDAGAAFGAGYRLKGKGWSFGLRLYHGLTNVYKARSGTNNRALFLKVSVPIGATKAKERREAKAKEELENKKE